MNISSKSVTINQSSEQKFQTQNKKPFYTLQYIIVVDGMANRLSVSEGALKGMRCFAER
jgi:hypothetical protein